ncbi:MAG: hypothetical protein A2103_03580 [Gammaproteobacteria bacterium GWF2_41_13]|nr:MAG: hypothetical protein A2103_03580 [Gammaproteobacteria bacterium GWF2_41_13]
MLVVIRQENNHLYHIDKVLMSKVVYREIAAIMEFGEIFYQQRRYWFLTSLCISKSKCGNQKIIDVLVDIDQRINLGIKT